MILHVVRGYWIPLKVEAFAGLGFIGHTDRSFQVKIRLMCLVCVFLVNLILVACKKRKELFSYNSSFSLCLSFSSILAIIVLATMCDLEIKGERKKWRQYTKKMVGHTLVLSTLSGKQWTRVNYHGFYFVFFVLF